MEGGSLQGEELEAVRVEVDALLSEGVAGATSGADVAERLQFLAQAEQMLHQLPHPDQPLVVQAITTLLSLRLDPSPPLRRVLPTLLEFLVPQLFLTPQPWPFSLLTDAAGTLAALVEDESPMVARRALQCAARVLPELLRAVVEARLPQEGRALFAEVLRLKQLAQTVINGPHHPAIGIQVVKLMETFTLCFSSAEGHKRGFSLEDIPPQHAVLTPAMLIEKGHECLNLLIDLAKRSERERTAGERLAVINCLAVIIAQRPSLARLIVPHLGEIDACLVSAFEPLQLTNVRQTLKLSLQFMAKLSTHGFASAVATAAHSVGATREKSYEETLEEMEQAADAKTSSSSSHKRKAEELAAGGSEESRAAQRRDSQPPAKRLATEQPAIPGLPNPPVGAAGLADGGGIPIMGPIPGIGAGSYPGSSVAAGHPAMAAAAAVPGLGMGAIPGFGPSPAPAPFSGIPGMISGAGAIPFAAAAAAAPPPAASMTAGAPVSSGATAEGGGDLGIPPLVLSRFVLDHMANLPPTRDLVRLEPLPPMDIDNLVKLLGTLTAARIQLQTQMAPTAAVSAAAGMRDPRARREGDEHLVATVPPLPGLGLKEGADQAGDQKARLATVKVAPPVLPIQIALPTIGPVPIANPDRMRANTVMRIVKAENKIATAGAGGLRRGLVARLATMHSLDDDVSAQLIAHIAQNLVLRHELALEWLYQEAVRATADVHLDEGEREEGATPSSRMDVESSEHGTAGQVKKEPKQEAEENQHEHMDQDEGDEKDEKESKDSEAGSEALMAAGKYGELLRRIMVAVDTQELSMAQETVYCRLLANVPLLTPASISLIEDYVASGRRVHLGLSLLKDLIMERPSVRDRCLHSLLSYALHAEEAVRGPAVRMVANRLFTEDYLAPSIEQFARDALFSFIDAHTPADKESGSAGGDDDQKEKDGDTGKEQDGEIGLYFALCLKKPDLLDGMLEAYTRAGVGVKKAIHKQAPQVVRGIGMSNAYMRRMVQSFPKGAETLVLQALHLLTDQATPTPELTEAVKEAYATRTHDARFLIPVLAGLTKDETIDNLPKLINLPPAIVKNVIHRLLHNKPTPITPEELLVALHVVDQDKKDVPKDKDRVPLRKIVDAIQHCMEQKEYSQGILAIVLQQLIDVAPLPALLMRTIIQTVHKYPKLTGFVMGLLSRLITKQVWADDRLWQGWIKCCRSTMPHSYSVMLQLPPRQLEDVLQKHPDLKQPLAHYQQTNPSGLPRASLALLGLV